MLDAPTEDLKTSRQPLAIDHPASGWMKGAGGCENCEVREALITNTSNALSVTLPLITSLRDSDGDFLTGRTPPCRVLSQPALPACQLPAATSSLSSQLSAPPPGHPSRRCGVAGLRHLREGRGGRGCQRRERNA